MKIAIVTGGNTGMGKATAAALADHGFHVVIACRNQFRGEATLADLISKPGRS